MMWETNIMKTSNVRRDNLQQEDRRLSYICGRCSAHDGVARLSMLAGCRFSHGARGWA